MAYSRRLRAAKKLMNGSGCLRVKDEAGKMALRIN